MTDEELYTQNARDYADIAEHWARRSQRYANSIDLPAAMLITLGISLLLTCIIITITLGGTYAQCQR